MVKKCLYALLIPVAIMLLSACQGKAALSPSDPGGAAPPESAESGTIGAVCRDTLLAFESAAPDNPLATLSYRYGQAHSFAVADNNALAKIYSALLSMPLGSVAEDPGILDADIVFSFVRKNGEEFTVRFVTQDYFMLYEAENAAWKFYSVPDSSLVRRCQDDAMAAASESKLPERPLFGDVFALDITQDACDGIDLDGDGQSDKLFFDFIDNGDEACGALELSVSTADKYLSMRFYPAGRETMFACGVPYTPGRSLLLIATGAESGWPSNLFFITVQNGKLMQYQLEDVEITDYHNGVFTLSNMQTVDVAQIHFTAVKQ